MGSCGTGFGPGKDQGEARAFADRALDLEAAAHRADQRPRLVGADAEALFLGRDEGLEQARADEILGHAAAAVGNLDDDVAAAFEGAQIDRVVGRAGVDRVLDEVDERLLEPLAVGQNLAARFRGRRGRKRR